MMDDSGEENFAFSEDPPKVIPEFLFCHSKPSKKTGPLPIEEEPYSSIKILVDGIKNDSPHPQVRYSMQFFRKNDIPYLFYSYRNEVFRINLEKCGQDEVENKNEVEVVHDDMPYFYLSKYSNKFFQLFSGELHVYDLETKASLFNPVNCYDGGSFNSITLTRDEKRLFSVSQTDHLCLYDLNEEEKKMKLLWTHDLGDYGNQIILSKDEKWVSLVTDDVGGFIFRYHRDTDKIEKVVNNFEFLETYYPHFEVFREREIELYHLRGQSNFSDFNCDTTRCVICSGKNLMIFRLGENNPEETTYLETFLNVSILRDEEEDNEEYGVYFGGSTSYAKYSPTNPDLLVFTMNFMSGVGYESDHKVYLFKHGGGGKKENENEKKGQIIRFFDLSSYEHHFGTLPKIEEDPVETKEELEEEQGFPLYLGREHNPDDRNFNIYSCEFHDDGRTIYVSLNVQSLETSKFIKMELKDEYWGSKFGDSKVMRMHRKDLKERIDFLMSDDNAEEYFFGDGCPVEKKKIIWGGKNSVIVFDVFLLD